MFAVLFVIISARAVQIQVYDGPWLSKKHLINMKSP